YVNKLIKLFLIQKLPYSVTQTTIVFSWELYLFPVSMLWQYLSVFLNGQLMFHTLDQMEHLWTVTTHKYVFHIPQRLPPCPLDHVAHLVTLVEIVAPLHS